jgi:hypothetical protein
MSSRRMLGGPALLWKTLTLRAFQIVQLTSMVMEAIALRFGEALQAIMDHQSLMERFAIQSIGWIEGIPIQLLIKPHSLLE